MKRSFTLQSSDPLNMDMNWLEIKKDPYGIPYVSLSYHFNCKIHYLFLSGKELERFAVNILKTIKSEKVKFTKRRI